MDTKADNLTLLRYKDLVEKKIVSNRVTLRRWTETGIDPFPKPIRLAENSIAWRQADVAEWLERRAKGDGGE